MSLGIQLRQARQKAQLSLRDLSARAGISIAKLSKVENGLATLRHPELIVLAEALAVPATTLLSPPADPAGTGARRAVTRADGGRKFEHSHRTYEMLCGELSGQSNLFWRVTVRDKPPGGADAFVSHPGEEFVHVLKGKVALHTEAYEPLVLAAGDSVLFDAQTRHAYFAVTREAVLLMSNTVGAEGARVQSQATSAALRPKRKR
ncbi:cupin domain-containing protein [Lysobacter enzymogenes]|uniref:helix-turn-helix domain-containing protein n=1 Tax=Lysobacter enzymogenes TaxID=69 RepID=UPI003749843E